MERAENGDGGIKAGGQIGERDTDLLRSGTWQSVPLAIDAHHPAHGLDHEVVARLFRKRPILAEAGN
jgi:hypothetical protein